MKIRLGYVATPITIEESYSKNLTYTQYKKLGKEKGNDQLSTVIEHNLKSLKKVLLYNKQNGITFYRLSHNIIPLATHSSVFYSYKRKYQKDFYEIGLFLKKENIRTDMHIDPYCVINSENPLVVQNSIEILKYHDYLFSSMDYNGKIILHIGSSSPDKKEALNRFKQVFMTLPQKIKQRIILENDDKVYQVSDVLSLCQDLNIPMVLDYHHFLCLKGKNIEKYLPQILDTWKEEKPKIHFSTPKSRKEYKSHHTYINCKKFIEFLSLLKRFDRDLDIMLECKGKDEALFRLIRQLKFYTDYKFIDETTFEI